MCAISGIVSLTSDEGLLSSLTKMMKVQTHRGPDGNGSWQGRVGSQNVGLGHNRLSILDLSEAGSQPLISTDGRHVLIYNGEIYNYVELRDELHKLGARFHSNCDSEVVLKSLIVWGEEVALQKFNGMWALAWLDLDNKRLLLSRDRLGEKPLYYFRGNNGFYFASEIKAILAGSGQRFSVDLRVAARYIKQSLLDAQEETFFAGIRCLPAGHNVTLNLSGLPNIPCPRVQHYWSPSLNDEFHGNIATRMEAIRETFVDSVCIRMRSDVPVGVMLSGGLGSSSIAGAMRSLLGKNADLHMISAVSDDARFNEEPFIDTMTSYLNCDSHKVAWRPNGSQAFKLFESVTYFNDEPVGDFSSVIHHLLMQRARELGISVVLSGQGDDELLCGYKKYLGFYIQDLVRKGKWLKATNVFAKFLARGTVISQFTMAEAKHYLPKFIRNSGIDTSGPLLRGNEGLMDIGLGECGVLTRQLNDLLRFSVPTQVHYEDRMSMACSREVRLPFLDYRLVNLLLPLSPEWKLRDGWAKWIFRKAMERHLPAKITWRKDKLGFANPQSEWLKFEFRDEVQRILSGDLLIESSGLVNRAGLRKAYDAYCKQRGSHGQIRYQDILHPIALELWMRRFESHLSLDTLSSEAPGRYVARSTLDQVEGFLPDSQTQTATSQR